MRQKIGNYEYEIGRNGKYTGLVRCVGGKLQCGKWPTWNRLSTNRGQMIILMIREFIEAAALSYTRHTPFGPYPAFYR